MAGVRVESASVSVTTSPAGTTPALAEAASDPTTLALAATCPFIRDVLATQDPQAISNTLAPFMALANTTDATRAFAHRARGVAPAKRNLDFRGPGTPAGAAAAAATPGAGAPREGRDTVGEDWVMTDLSGADAPAPTGGRPIRVGGGETVPGSADIPLIDTSAATGAETLTASEPALASAAPADASATPATAVATSAADVAPGPPTPAGGTARHIPMKTPEQATAEGTTPAGAAAAEAEAERGGPVEATAPKEAPPAPGEGPKPPMDTPMQPE